MQVTIEPASPGMFTRIEVVEPPYCAVVDAGQHDERRERIKTEGDRQQHRDGGDRPDAGQHADQRAQQASEQRKAEILSDTAAPNPVARFWNRSNSMLAAPPGRQRLSQQVDEHDDGERREAGAEQDRFGELDLAPRIGGEHGEQ